MDLRKGSDRPAFMGGGSSRSGCASGGSCLPAIIVMMCALLAAMLLCFYIFFWGHREIKTTEAAPAQAPAPAARQAAAPAGPYVRIEWYEPFDPKKSDDIFGRVQDQYGCWWWDQLGNHNWTHSYRAYRDGRPDCPADAMPDPLVEYLPQAEADDLRDDITVVSRTVVQPGDPDLVAWYRQRRDDAEAEGQ